MTTMRMTPDDVVLLTDLLRAGVTKKEIMEGLECSRATATRYLALMRDGFLCEIDYNSYRYRYTLVSSEVLK